MTQVKDMSSMTVPVGTIMMWAGDTSGSSIVELSATGWLVCDGSQYQQTSSLFSALYSIIGTSYGGVGGQFCVPMLNGMFLRGVTGGSASDPDATTRTAPRPDLANAGSTGNNPGSMQGHQYESHAHSYDEYSSLHNQDHVAAHDTINKGSSPASLVASGGAETRPKNVYVYFIIKYRPNDASVPPGAVMPYGGAVATPTTFAGWMACDGSGQDQAQNPGLFEAIGTYSGGAGTTFYLPDYRGRFLRGVEGTPLPGVPVYDPDSASRTSPTAYTIPGNSGNQVGSLQADAFLLHSHTYDYNNSYQYSAATAIGFSGVAYDRGTASYTSGVSGGAETRPLNLYVNYLVNAEGGLPPIGGIVPYAGSISPANEAQLIAAGYIPCDGRGLALSNAAYTALQQIIGTAYGGDGVNFYVPDCRGVFLRGVDNGAGNDPDAGTRAAPRPDLATAGNAGDAVGSLQPCNIAQHAHTYLMHTGDHNCNYGSLVGPGVYTGATSSETSGTAGAVESRPVNVYANYLIRYR